MLETLKIRNIAVIDSAEIPFKSGLNILSGETGAGKSIVIEAISLILGGRASTELIRSGCDEATVEGFFDIGEIPWIRERLARHGFEGESSELLIKRTIHSNGKNRVYVNGELATLGILQDLCEGLVDLCGQHEHQSLLKPATQIELIDRYGGSQKLTEEFSNLFNSFRSIRRELETLGNAEAERQKHVDFLQFQIEELKSAELHSGEESSLASEKTLLQSAETRIQTASAIAQALEAEESGILVGARLALQKAKALSVLDPSAQELAAGVERAFAELEEASLAVSRYSRGIDLDPERLTTVLDRISLIGDLRRKYGSTVEEMIATLARLEEELVHQSSASERAASLEVELATHRKELSKRAEKLTAARKKSSELFAKSVTAELKDLKMGEAKLLVDIVPRQEEEWGPTGADQIQFLAQTNRGESAKPLSKIASGGELSRMMLAIRRVIADRGGIGVYLFDEIDAGIGGQTAFEVGRKLKSVAAYNQVICITHLPQVASFADHHLSVQKAAQGTRTQTRVVELKVKERKEELARMLGGPQLTKKSLENAAELLQMAKT